MKGWKVCKAQESNDKIKSKLLNRVLKNTKIEFEGKKKIKKIWCVSQLVFGRDGKIQNTSKHQFENFLELYWNNEDWFVKLFY